MSLPKHFVDLIFQCPSFTFLSVSGTRSLHPAGLHMAKFILYWMTNCIWICRVEGQGCSLWVSQAPSKCLSHENVLEFPFCCSLLKCSWIPNSALTWMPNNRVLPEEEITPGDWRNEQRLARHQILPPGAVLVNGNPEFWKRPVSWALKNRCILRARPQPVNPRNALCQGYVQNYQEGEQKHRSTLLKR